MNNNSCQCCFILINWLVSRGEGKSIRITTNQAPGGCQAFEIIFAFKADKFRETRATVLADQSRCLVWADVFQYWLRIGRFKGSACCREY